jgi:hypothetical protein
MYGYGEVFISFLQSDNFNKFDIVKVFERVSIIMDDFHVATIYEKKYLDSLAEFYNYLV